jgi:hypothetical protein
MCIKINKIGKQEVGIWWVQKRFPRYGVPIWNLWPNIRFLPSIVAEKNVTKNVHIYVLCWFLYTFNIHLYMHIFRRIFLSNYWWRESDIWSQASYRYAILWEAFLDPSDSYFLFADLVGFYTHWTYMHIFRHIFLSNYWWQRSDIWSQASYRYPISWEVFLGPSDSCFLFADWSRNLMGPKCFPRFDIKLVTKYQISAINSYWEKCDEKYLGRTEVKQYTPLPLRGV